jgi:MoxR-like ATPase
MSWRVLNYFGLGKHDLPAASRDAALDEDDPALMMTGDALTTAILENIRLRRSVLVTGPRGCGKSYCSEQAIKLAKAHGLIGGSRFLQGNREIPRDALSEDMLIVGEGNKVELLKALALRPLEESGSITREGFPDWPGIPRGLGIDPTRVWTNRDWMVLFLDEINRFGDGFLDSLLALLEERKIVRRGQDYYVPIVVVATANPPGYDMTAKKLSPPLQARITRSFRVSQPDIEVLVHKILPSKILEFGRDHPQGAPEVPIDVRYLAAGATLCLWGDPTAGSKGRYFLTRGTRALLSRVMAADSGFARDMREISTLIDFGPDARAVTDWIGCAMARAATEGASTVTAKHLEETAVHVLSHKVREKFNEGANPNLGIRRDRLILNIVQRTMQTRDMATHFGHAEAQRPPSPPSAPATSQIAPVALPERRVRALICEYSNAGVFVDTLVHGYPHYQGTVLPTAEHVRIWLNTVDGVLQPYATPGDIQQIVHQGFLSLVRALRPGQHYANMSIVQQARELFEHTYHAVERAANPAGQERARAARQAVAMVAEAIARSPANPQNTPQPTRPGSW